MKTLMIFYGETGADMLSSLIKCSLESKGVDCDVINMDSRFTGSRLDRFHSRIKSGGYSHAIVFQSDVAARLSELKKRSALEFEIIMVCQNYGCPRDTASLGADKYVIPHEELRFEFVGKNVEDAKILSFGLPLGSECCRTAGRGAARTEIGLDSQKGVVLYLCDGASVSEACDAVTVLAELCGESFNHVVLCGDRANAEKYSLKFSKLANVYVESKFDSVYLYMDACDIAFSAPNAVLLTAAAARMIPVILFRAYKRDEKMNVEFFCGRGMAFTGKTARDKASYAARLCTTARFRDNITDAQKKYITADGAERLANYISETHRGD
ncbi:MAG: hypothetical protein FWF05_04970 [Oscillospiraceae bacterium]|nr:hypothetical protein [Oscillospiraceae bacterium]